MSAALEGRALRLLEQRRRLVFAAEIDPESPSEPVVSGPPARFE
jgi:hypothetical protein